MTTGACHQASAARQLNAAASPTSAYKWLPHKNEDNVWQPAQTEGVDYTKLTLQDLPPPEVFVQMAMQSPYPMPGEALGYDVEMRLSIIELDIYPTWFLTAHLLCVL